MFKLGILVLLLGTQLLCAPTTALHTVSSHLSSSDVTRLQHVFIDGLSSNGLQSIYYSTVNVETTNEAEKADLCKRIHDTYMESKLNDFEKNLYLVGAHKNAKCTTLAIPQAVLNKISSSFNKDALKAMGVTIDAPTSTKIAKNLQNILKKDDSLSSLGYSLVSDIFTGLCLTPLVLLFILWGKLGINVSNFTFSLSTIGFHFELGSILGLFGLYWIAGQKSAQ